MQKACLSPGSKWRVLESVAAYNDARAKALKKKKQSQVVVLKYDAGEEVDIELHAAAKTLDLQKFQASINRVDATKTTS